MLARALVTVREATPEDLPHVAALWGELRTSTQPGERSLPPAPEAQLLAKLAELQRDPGIQLVVAIREDTLLGMACYAVGPTAPLSEGRAVHVHYLHVREGARRRGVGHALLAAVTAYAEACGAEHVVVSTAPNLRETSRFYARLGFDPVVLRRACPVSALRRRLAMDHPALEGRDAFVDDLVARRRLMRARSRMRALAR